MLNQPWYFPPFGSYVNRRALVYLCKQNNKASDANNGENKEQKISSSMHWYVNTN